MSLHLEYLGYLTLLWKFPFIFSSWKVFHQAKHRLRYFWTLCFLLSWNLCIKPTNQFVNLLNNRKCLFRLCSLGLTNPVSQNLFYKNTSEFHVELVSYRFIHSISLRLYSWVGSLSFHELSIIMPPEDPAL